MMENNKMKNGLTGDADDMFIENIEQRTRILTDAVVKNQKDFETNLANAATEEEVDKLIDAQNELYKKLSQYTDEFIEDFNAIMLDDGAEGTLVNPFKKMLENN